MQNGLFVGWGGTVLADSLTKRGPSTVSLLFSVARPLRQQLLRHSALFILHSSLFILHSARFHRAASPSNVTHLDFLADFSSGSAFAALI